MSCCNNKKSNSTTKEPAKNTVSSPASSCCGGKATPGSSLSSKPTITRCLCGTGCKCKGCCNTTKLWIALRIALSRFTQVVKKVEWKAYSIMRFCIFHLSKQIYIYIYIFQTILTRYTWLLCQRCFGMKSCWLSYIVRCSTVIIATWSDSLYFIWVNHVYIFDLLFTF